MVVAKGESLSTLDGLRAFASGIGFVLTTPRVWPYAVVPMFLMLLLGTGFIALGIWAANSLANWMFGTDTETLGTIGNWTVTVFLALAAILLALLVALGLAQPLSSFALEAIARIREQCMTGRPAPNPPFIASLLGSVKVGLATVILGGIVISGLLIVDLAFPPAMIVTVPLKFLVTAWLLAWNFIDYPLGLRQAGLRARFAWVRRNFGAFTAFGVAWSLLVIVPGILLLLLPMGVAGATTMVVEAGDRPREGP